MKKMTKRTLSLFLSLVMVFTTIPFYALVAHADATKSSYTFLTDGIDSGLSNTGGVTWDSGEHAAYFNGNGYLTFPHNPFDNVNNSNGFAISFDFKTKSDNADNGRIIDINDGTTSNTFAINGGSISTNDYRRAITLAKVNDSECTYYSNDLANGSYTTGGGTQWLPAPNVWYTLTVVMDVDGYYSYYVDGTLFGTFKNNYNDVFSGANSVTPTMIKNQMANMTQMTIGRAVYNDPYYKGYIRNVTLINGLTDIDVALKHYEDKMANGIYTNMPAAYTAYQKASARADSVNYGGKTASEAGTAAAAQELNLATINMRKPEFIIGTKKAAYDNSYSIGNASSSFVCDDTMSNVLWTYGVGGNSSYTDTNTNDTTVGVQYGDIIFLYNGGAMECPINCYYKRSSLTGTRRLRSIRPTTASFSMTKHYWHGESSSTGYQSGTDDRASTIDNESTTLQNSRTTYYNTNTLKYSGTGSNSSIYSVQVAFTWYNNNGNNSNVTASAKVQVVDYSRLVTKLNSVFEDDCKDYFENISNYKEGGLASFLTTINTNIVEPNGYFSSANSNSAAETAATNLNTAITNAVSGLNSLPTPTADSNYKALKNAIDNPGPTTTNISTSVLDAYGHKTGSGGVNDGGYTTDSFGTFATAYENAKAKMAALYNQNSYPSTSVSSETTALNNGFNGLALVPISVPSFSQGEGTTSGSPLLVGAANNSLVITNNESGATVHYTVTYDSGAAISDQTFNTASTNIGEIFDNDHANATTATVDAYTVKDGNNSGHTIAYFKKYLAPTVNSLVVARGANLASVVSSNNTSGTIKYSTTENGTYYDVNSYIPFPADSSTDSSVTVYIREEYSATVYSAATAYTFVRKGGDLTAYQEPANSKGEEFFDVNATIKLPNASSYSGTVYYTLTKDGGEEGGTQEYNKTNGFTIDGGTVVKVKAWAGTATDQATETFLYNAATSNGALVYHESFTGASVSGSAFNTGMTTGKNATATGTISVEKGAGTKTSSGKESHSWRNNVLKINANSTAPGPVVTLSSNPLSESTTPALVAQNGVTIAFWRHLEDTSGNTVNLPSTGDPTGYPWRNAIAFQKNGDNSQYYIIEVNGVNSRRIDGSHYQDVVPENQDNTAHEEGNNNGEWEHVTITINPTGGMHVYTNGVEHDYKYVRVNSGSGEHDTNDIHNYDIASATAANASEILDFLTQSSTDMTFDNGVLYEGNEYNLFLDDIRIYSKALSQVEINNMYTDKYADIQTNITSTSHDPTTVTVYTLGSDLGTYTGHKRAAGSKVGREFIEYYGIDPSTCQVEYYSFGTGMTVYKAGETVTTITGDTQIRWEVLGDSAGRCGYQNQDLFGGEYTTALAPVITAANFDSSEQANGAGHLVWAPHVMYNINRDEWVYYGSMSSWGSLHSATFMCTSDDPIRNYTYNSLVYQSKNWTPNAIDMSAFYGRTAQGDIDPDKLYMTMGSYNWDWANETPNFGAIYGMEINADGTAKYPAIDSMQSHGTQLSRAYMADLEETTEGQGSCEGSYVEYINGYYYLFVSFGSNAGSYTERVFRSTNPLGPYAGTNGIDSNTGESIHKNRGNQLLAPFDSSVYTKIYRSTGHNSVYKAKNNDGEWVYVNSVHARPYASETHGWTAVQDNALAKRQSGDVTGNVSFNNMMGVTEHNWLVMFPYQYNGTDTIYKQITAKQLEGLYAGNNMRLKVDSSWGHEYQYTFLANEDDSSNTTGCVYGVRGDDTEFRMKFKLVRNVNNVNDNVQYIRIYDDSATYDQILKKNGESEPTVIHEGIIGVHTKAGKQILMMGTLDITNGANSGLQYWAYRKADVPDVDKVISHGDQVSMDGVIYTHASDAEALDIYQSSNSELALKSAYALYGQEISDNFSYGQNNYATGGERYTTFATKYPNYIEMDSSYSTPRSVMGSVISLNDTEYCRNYGHTGSNMYAVGLSDGWWCTKSGSAYTKAYETDEAAAAAIADNPNLELYKVYGLKGTVSNYFKYYNNQDDGSGTVRNGYPEVGVTLVIAYKDCTNGNEYSEFEFCYVMPNPAWAHTVAATKNHQSDTIGNDRNSSYGIFNSFENSYGEATDLSSSMLYYAARGNEEGGAWDYGTSGYLTDFSTHSFSDTDLDTLDEIRTLMNKSPNKAAGVNAGSFSAQIHNDTGPNSYIATPQVIDTRYYVDYSDKSNYIANNPNTGMITSDNGVPTGYQFKMKTNNFLWANYSGSSIMDVTSYQMNKTGLSVTYSSNPATSNAGPDVEDYLGSYTTAGNYNTNFEHFGTDVTLSGYKRWFDDAMLFHTDLRNNTNSHFNFPYRNKVLFYFSDGTQNYLKKDDVSYHAAIAGGRGTDYVDGTSKDSDTPSKVYNYYNYAGSKAYAVAPNGKASTNSWTGTATFTGKNRVNANTIESLNKNYGDGRTFDTTANRLYDGYYYYENANNNVKRECWTPDYETAYNNRDVNGYGRLDVTAENYANYILEMGNYHKVTDSGVKGGRFIGNETYHYYNIGVATCDKGAARDFIDNFAIKELAYTTDENGKKHVTLDANGRPTATADMQVEDISAASYRDYLNAIAKLEWFVHNPQNTLQNDLKGEATYEGISEIQNASSDEYTTAYSGGNAIYLANKSGDNVFNDGATANTDNVQAKLIADVIEAYEHLYTVEDYKEVEKAYKETQQTLIDAETDIDAGLYTDSSVETYTEDIDILLNSVKFYTTSDGSSDEAIDPDLIDTDDMEAENYWRYSEYSGKDYDKILDILADLKDSLMLKTDVDGGNDVVTIDGVNSNIAGTITTKQATYNGGIFENGEQTSTLTSLNDLGAAITDATSVKNANTGLARFTDTEKSETLSDGTTITYRLPDATYSTAQQNINAANADLIATDLLEIADYSAYDAVVEALKYQDMGAFSSAYLSSGNSIFDTLSANGVGASTATYSLGARTGEAQTVTTPAYDYSDSTAKNVPYVTYNGTVYKDVAAADQLTKIDPIVTAIQEELTAVNGGTTSDAASFTVTFETYIDGTLDSTVNTTKYYNTQWTNTYSGANSVLRWTIDAEGAATKTVTGTNTYSFNVFCPATVKLYLSTKGSASADEGKVLIHIENSQEAVVDTFSVDSDSVLGLGATGIITVDSSTVYTAPSISFLQFNGWRANGKNMNAGNYTASEIADEDGVLVLRMKYKNDEAGNATFSITNDGTALESKAKSEEATVNKASGATALAYKLGNDYYVATYDGSYTFLADGDVDFVSITKSGDVYSANGTTLDSTTYAELYKLLDSKRPMNFSVTSTDGAFFIHSAPTQGTLGTNVTIDEVGTLYANAAVVSNPENMEINAANVYKVQAKTQDSTGQYFLKINTSKNVYARAYIKYTYVDTASGLTITTIGYGNVVKNF